MNPLPFEVVRKVVEDELLGGLPLEEAQLGLGLGDELWSAKTTTCGWYRYWYFKVVALKSSFRRYVSSTSKLEGGSLPDMES